MRRFLKIFFLLTVFFFITAVNVDPSKILDWKYSQYLIKVHQISYNYYYDFIGDKLVSLNKFKKVRLTKFISNENYKIEYFEKFTNLRSPRHPRSKIAGFIGANSTDSNSMIFVTANGVFFKISSDIEDTDNLNIEIIDSNLPDIIKNKFFHKPYPEDRHGIKDITLTSENKVIISISDRNFNKNCTYAKVLIADFNSSKKLIFSPIFKSDCIDLNKGQFHNNAAHMLGARIKLYNNEKEIIMGLGMLNNFNLPQDDNNFYGKIIKFPIQDSFLIDSNIDKSKVSVLAKGIRNPQGLDVLENNVIVSSHGPKGGDVLNHFNLNDKAINYGFPIVSYGTHYDGSFSTDIGLDVALASNNVAPDYAPFYQDPLKFGYDEALFNWTPSIAPSQVRFLNYNNKKSIILSSMGYRGDFGQQSIHKYDFINNDGSLIISDSIIVPLGGRIRDIENQKERIWFWDESNGLLGRIKFLSD